MRGMFQPQPTPLASSCFASPSFTFPAAPTTTTSAAAASNNTVTSVASPSATHDSKPIPGSGFAPSSSAVSPYALEAPGVPFGFYFPPASGGGGAGAGAGSGIGSGGAGRPATAQRRASVPAARTSAASASASTPSRRGPGAASPISPAPGLICGSSLPASPPFASSANLPTRQPRHQHRRSHHHRSSPAPKMEDQSDPHGMAAQQAAAKDYQPDLPNYLVGNKTPSDAITQEYAKADQTFVEKTVALPQRYSHFRPVQGDGNCGWRAIGFSYFEKLVDNGDRIQIENEANRLLGMNPMLGDVGGYDYYEDWAEEFIDFLREVANNIDNPAVAHELLHQKWNDVAATSGMIYYLRLLAATYLKANSEQYDPFIADSGGVHGYCSQSIELINREIEHLGVVALANVLLKPVNFVLEIAYLDRSPGSQVNTYRLPDEANNQDELALGPIIYLLYRPDHYDILYRSPPDAPSHPVSIQVHRVNGFSNNAGISSTQSNLGAFSTVDFDTLSMLPGFGGPGMPMSPPAGGPPVSESFQSGHQPQNPWAPQFGLAASSPQPNPPQPPVVAAGPPTNPPLSPHDTMGPRPPAAGVGAQPGMMPGTSLAPSPECTIRFSPMQLEYDGSQGSYPEPTFQVKTNTFKNSVWNRAHFGNPDFHPEEWSPEDENVDGRIGSKRRGSRREA